MVTTPSAVVMATTACGKGADHLTGGDGADRISGGAGDDVIDGGAGADFLRGGAGEDTFVFHGGGGQDVIMDFEEGEDILHVSKNINGLDVHCANDIASLAHDVGGNTVIDFGGGDQITLVGVKAADVHANPSAFFVIS
jgi:Ca2+-binding RTX toxin-like protein